MVEQVQRRPDAHCAEVLAAHAGYRTEQEEQSPAAEFFRQRIE